MIKPTAHSVARASCPRVEETSAGWKPALRMRARRHHVLCSLVLLLCCRCVAAEEPQVISFQAASVTNSVIKVPASDRPSVLAFVRTGQPQSEEALKQLSATVPNDAAQIVLLVSGPQAGEEAKTLQNSKYLYPIVCDPDFETSGKLGVHVWPTTLVVATNGKQVAHLAGLADAYAIQLDAYLKFASGKIDDAALQKLLAGNEVVLDDNEQKAARHLHLAEKLLEQGASDVADQELTEAIKCKPHDPQTQIAMAKVLTLLEKPTQAIDLLNNIPAGLVPPARKEVVRGRALVVLGKWDEAKAALTEALVLNPDPSEANYLLGVVYQHANDTAHAQECFRKAYETTPLGKLAAIKNTAATP